MRKFLVLIVLLVSVALIGVRRGWFQVDSKTDNQKLTVTVDKDKIREDEAKAIAKVHDAKDKVVDVVHSTVK